jgi:hypothetical protein
MENLFLKFEEYRPSNKGGSFPLSDSQEKAIKLAQSLRFHSSIEVDEKKAKEFLKTKAPNQSKEEFAYELANFQIWTSRIYNKCERAFDKVINPSIYSVEYEFELDGYDSLHTFFNSIFIKKALQDPNSVRVTEPTKYQTYENENGTFIDDSQPIKCTPKIIDIDKIIINNDTEFAYIKEETREAVKVAYFDLNSYSIVTYDIKNKSTSVTLKIEHNFEVKTWQTVGYIYEVLTNDYYFASPLSNILPDMNDYLKNRSNLTVGMQSRIFADRIEIGDKSCTVCVGKGHIFNDDGHKVECNHCNGSGIEPRSGLTTTKWINVNELDPQAASVMKDSISYITPPLSPMEFVKNFCNELEQMIYKSLAISLSSEMDKTATEVSIDRSEHQSQLMAFANQLYDHYENAIIEFNLYSGNEGYTLVRPISLSLLSQADLIKELTESKDTIGAALIENEYIEKRFGENRRIEIYKITDSLRGKTIEQKASLLTLELVSKWQVILSIKFDYFYDLIESESDFDMLTNDEISQLIIQRAQEDE